MSTFFSASGGSPPRRFAGFYPGEVAPADTPVVDFKVSNHGTILLLQPLSAAARAWADAHLPADRQFWGSSTVVEHRYIADIVAGIHGDGLVVA